MSQEPLRVALRIWFRSQYTDASICPFHIPILRHLEPVSNEPNLFDLSDEVGLQGNIGMQNSYPLTEMSSKFLFHLERQSQGKFSNMSNKEAIIFF